MPLPRKTFFETIADLGKNHDAGDIDRRLDDLPGFTDDEILSNKNFLHDMLRETREVSKKVNEELNKIRAANEKPWPTRAELYRKRAFWLPPKKAAQIEYEETKLSPEEEAEIEALIRRQCPPQPMDLDTKMPRDMHEELTGRHVDAITAAKEDLPVLLDRHKAFLAETQSTFEEMHEWRGPAFEALINALPEGDERRTLLPGGPLDPRVEGCCYWQRRLRHGSNTLSLPK